MRSDESFTVLVTGGVLSSQANFAALRFVESALRQNKVVARVFFYSEAATVASNLLLPLSDELDATSVWQALQVEFGLELDVCIASAERRGIIGEQSAAEHALPSANLATGFRVVGLAQLHDAMLSSSHLVHFG